MIFVRQCTATFVVVAAVLPNTLLAAGGSVRIHPQREAYYGDLHLHTGYSLDAYLMGTTSIGPDEAYRFAQGETVQYLGQPARRREPLDFLAVTDHAENIGVQSLLADPDSRVSQSDWGKTFKRLMRTAREAGASPAAKKEFQDLWKVIRDSWVGSDRNALPQELRSESASAWQREIDAANRHYRPGQLTTFIAYEWTSTPYGDNLHRNVIFKGDSAPYPFTSLDSKKPEDLWAWLDAIRAQGYDALAIPHNGNASNGLMYDWVDSRGFPIDSQHAQTRQTNEPLTEISQIKGSSETHPLLSPNDEFANYEILDRVLWVTQEQSRPSGSYVRNALSRGLVLQREIGVNPYKYGVVGGSDLHTGLSVSAQADFVGGDLGVNLGCGQLSREQASQRLKPKDAPSSAGAPDYDLRMTSGNLTGVWAESNTRESIFQALRRRETFATSGTRLKVRFFAGWDFPPKLLEQKDWVTTAYAQGVPMGSDLPQKPGRVPNTAGPPTFAPTFAIQAAKDPNGANLDRIQVVKVWEAEGQQKEKVFDVAWAGARKPDPKTGKLSAIGDTVNLKTGKATNSIGAAELKTLWTDPEFNPAAFAAYYLRVLEMPTARWSTLLAIAQGLPLPTAVPATEPQRAWSSPIWLSPAAH